MRRENVEAGGADECLERGTSVTVLDEKKEDTMLELITVAVRSRSHRGTTFYFPKMCSFG